MTRRFGRSHVSACFDEFLQRYQGQARFEGRRPTQGRHRDRVWPALSRYKRRRRRYREPGYSHRAARVSRLIERACLLAVLRKWCPGNPLETHHMIACDLAQRPPQLDDFRRVR
jgi:hypothetical protein